MPSHTLSELARVAGADLEGDPEFVVSGTASLRDAGAEDISFCVERAYVEELAATRARAVLVPRDFQNARADLSLLRCDDVNRSFTKICALFALERPKPPIGVHASAVIHPTAALGANCAIGPLCSIGAGARVGANVVLHAGAVIGDECKVGDATEIHPHAVLYAGVSVGARCLIHAGAVIGSDGFGFAPPKKLGDPWSKIPQSGTVVVEDDVEIGSNTTIDRARFGTTRIARGVKLDNLIHIAHNCEIGAGTMIAAQTGIAGSARVGRGTMIGGQVGVNGHIVIGDGVRVGAQGGVMRDTPNGAEVWGTPARPKREAFRAIAAIERLPELLHRVAALEARIAQLDGRAKDSA